MHAATTSDPLELLTIQAAAALMAVSTFTVRRWIEAGKLTRIELSRGAIRVKRSEVEAVIEAASSRVPQEASK